MSKTFSDIAGRASEPAILNMAAMDVLNGYPDGTFRPTQNVTREELAWALDQLAHNLMRLASFDLTGLAKDVRRSTVQLVAVFDDLDSNGQAVEVSQSGGGVFVSKIGHIVTNDHVLRRTGNDGRERLPKRVEIHTGGWKVTTYGEGPIVATWPDDDLALVKFEQELDFPAMVLGSDPKPGEFVLACGAPLGVEDVTTLGIVTATDVSILHYRKTMSMVETDAAINPGNSGGALVDMAGRLVGIPSAKLAAAGIEGFGFAIPISTVKARLQEAGIPFDSGRPEPAKPAAPELSLDWPVHGEVTARFGETGPWWIPWHSGVDIACPEGSAVAAPCDAEVYLVAEEHNAAGELVGYGGYLILWAGPFWLLFGHLSSVAVRAGTVKRGQPLALSGSTGLSTGPHLHFGVYDSRLGPLVDPESGRFNWRSAVDPMKFLLGA